ncbi:MAG: flagellar motor switch protein FliN [Planctomycetales bacterium]|nr:flagellar motor switch protein FliN [Planctomycetales bacterium]
MADDFEQMGQDEIEQLLRSAQEAGGAGGGESAPASSKPVVDESLDQSEIEKLLSGSPVSMASAAAPSAAAVSSPPAAGGDDGMISQGDIESLLNSTEAALGSLNEPMSSLPPGIKSFEFQDFASVGANADSATLELMRDVQLDLTIELGRTHMHLEDVLCLKKGAVVPLEKLAGDPADIYVNGRLVARGEVLVLNDNFCVRVAELVRSDAAA